MFKKKRKKETHRQESSGTTWRRRIQFLDLSFITIIINLQLLKQNYIGIRIDK